MKSIAASARAMLAAAAVCGTLPAARGGDCGVDPAIGSQVVLGFSERGTIDTFWPTIQQHYPGTQILSRHDARRFVLLRMPTGVNAVAAAEFLDDAYSASHGNPSDPQHPLNFAEANYEGQAAEGHTGTIYDSRPAAFSVAFQSQYVIERLGVTEAQARSTGRGVMVALLDTGVDAQHPVLSGRILPQGFNFTVPGGNTDVADVGDGQDEDGDGEIDEMTGHGTYVAGLITLVAPEATILPVKVLNSDGLGDLWTISMGIFYAIDHGADVINASLGTDYDSDAIDLAVLEAYQRGIVVVGAAGNRNRTCPERPGAAEPEINDNDIEAAISVATVDDHDIRAPFSNHGFVFMTAPGTSAELPGQPGEYDPARSIIGPLPGDGYGIWEGTSMSTAFVSAAVALMRSQNPAAPATSMTVENAKDLLESTSVNIAALNPGFDLGTGRLNIVAAVQANPPQPVAGDVNADGHVDLADLALLLANYGAVQSPADIDGDGQVGLSDLSVLLSNFGA